MAHRHKKLTLRRDLGLFQATLCGVGIIVGAGIYVLIGAAAGRAGNAVWLSFLISAVVAAFTGLSYAELSSLFSGDAAEYIYTEEAFGRKFGFFIAYLVIISSVISAAAVAMGFAGYLSALLSTEGIFIIALASIIACSFISYKGIKETAWTNTVFTVLEAAGLLFIIIFSAKYIGRVNYLEMANGMKGVLSAASLIFFAYLGFETVVKFSEETKNPKKTIPKALLLSLGISTLVYVLVALGAVSVVGWETLANSNAPLALVAAALLGSKVFLALGIIALFSTGNTVLLILVSASRMLYGISKEYRILRPFSAVSERTRTPYIAVLAVMVVSILFLLIKNISSIAELTNFCIFIVFAAINAALIVIRYKKPKLHGSFRVPFSIGKMPVLPLLGVLTSLFMIFNLGMESIIGGVIVSVVGVVMCLMVK